jgi:hypothetical protein
VLGLVLHPKLERARQSRLESELEPLRKRPSYLLRADEVQLRRCRPLRRTEVDWVEFCFVGCQASTLDVEAL